MIEWLRRMIAWVRRTQRVTTVPSAEVRYMLTTYGDDNDSLFLLTRRWGSEHVWHLLNFIDDAELVEPAVKVLYCLGYFGDINAEEALVNILSGGDPGVKSIVRSVLNIEENPAGREGRPLVPYMTDDDFLLLNPLRSGSDRGEMS